MVKPNFTVQPTWRDEFYKRIVATGVDLDRKDYDAAAPYVSRLLELRIARVAFGDSAQARRELPYDAPLRKALELTAHSQSQQDLFAARTGTATAVVAPQKQR
jgi:hypothetical protein